MSNAMSLKAKICNIAKEKNIPAQVILQKAPSCAPCGISTASNLRMQKI